MVAVQVEKVEETKEESDDGERNDQSTLLMIFYPGSLSKTISANMDSRLYVGFDAEHVAARYDVYGRTFFDKLEYTVFTNGVFLCPDFWKPQTSTVLC